MHIAGDNEALDLIKLSVRDPLDADCDSHKHVLIIWWVLFRALLVHCFRYYSVICWHNVCR